MKGGGKASGNYKAMCLSISVSKSPGEGEEATRTRGVIKHRACCHAVSGGGESWFMEWGAHIIPFDLSIPSPDPFLQIFAHTWNDLFSVSKV